MNPPNMEEVARNLKRTAQRYVEEVFQDQLVPVVRAEFDAALHRRGMDDLQELASTPSAALAVLVGNDVRFGPKNSLQLVRVVGLKQVADVDEVRASGSRLAHQLIAATHAYVATLPVDTRRASYPTLHVAVEAYLVTWFLWGYVGVPAVKARKRGK